MHLRSCCAALMGALLLASCQQNPPPRILFVGNSITAYGPQAGIGWYGSWGMAASSGPTDYVHRVATAVGTGRFFALNTGWEVQYGSGFDYEALASSELARPDLLVVKLGENAVYKPEFKAEFAKLVECVRSPRVIVVSTWWIGGDAILINADMKSVANDNGYAWVQLPDHDASYNAPDFQDPGVALHPGDKGMQLIADAIVAELWLRGWVARSI